MVSALKETEIINIQNDSNLYALHGYICYYKSYRISQQKWEEFCCLQYLETSLSS